MRSTEPAHLAIRDIAASDEPAWRRLWADYITFYRVAVPSEVTDATWARLFDPQSALFARVAVLDDEVVGFAIALTHEATWTPAPVCYLEDLFVDAPARGHGGGRALLQDLIDMSRQRGWSRLYWHTGATNTVARGLYDHFVEADDHVRYRLKLD